MEVKNWILKKHIQNIEVISESYLPFYKEFTINKGVIVNEDFSKSKTFVNWNMYPKTYDFFYDYEGCEEAIEMLLFKSQLTAKNNVTMDFGYNNPVIQMEVSYFMKNWYDFIVGAHYESTVVSDDGKAVMEFTRKYHLLSNFLIK